MGDIYVFFLLILYALYMLLIAVTPSILNFLISFSAYLISENLLKVRIISIIIGVGVSIILTFNFRIPELLSDLSRNENNSSTANKILIKPGESLFINSDTKDIYYRGSAFSTVTVSQNSSCIFFLKSPRLIKENIYNSISNLGITTSYIEKSTYQLHVSSVKDRGTETISLVLSKDDKILNTRTIVTRQFYRGEAYLREKNGCSASAAFNYLFSATIWTPVFEFLLNPSPKRRIFSSALESVLSVDNKQIFLKNSVATLDNEQKIDQAELLDDVRSSKQIGCDTKNISIKNTDYLKHVLNVSGRRIPVNIGHHFESIVCTDNAIYVVSTPSKNIQFFELYEFSSDGDPVAHVKYRIDQVEWEGEPRKPLVYFKTLGDSIFLGILDINRDKKINNLYLYNLKTPSRI